MKEVVKTNERLGVEVADSIISISEIAFAYDKVQKAGEISSQKRKDNIKKLKEKMGESVDSMGLIPKPAYIPEKEVQTPLVILMDRL